MKSFSKILVLALGFNWYVTAIAAEDYVILEVGKHEITKSEIETIWNNLFPAGQGPAFEKAEEPIRQKILRGAVSEYVLYDEALKAGIDEEQEIQDKLALLERKLIVRHFIDQKSNELVEEADIEKRYDELVKERRGKKEINARHILVKTEEKAKELKEKLEDGEEFALLAKQHSLDPGSKSRGGELGFFMKGKMVPEFEEAAFELEEGEISEPVKSDFGWHIIQVVEKRSAQVPTLTEVKGDIKNQLIQDRLNDYVNDLVDQTDVTYYGPDGEEKELTNTPDTTATP